MPTTSIQLTEDEHKFVKENRLMFSQLLKEAILRRKEIMNGRIVDNIEEERRSKEMWKKTAWELRNKLNLLEAEKNGIK